MSALRHPDKMIINTMTPEESAQMTAMFNWSTNIPSIQKMSMYTFKQYSSKDKMTRLVYEIQTLIWTEDDSWKSIMEKGETLTEAMANWSKKWQRLYS